MPCRRPARLSGARSSGSNPERPACVGAAIPAAVTADLVQTALRVAASWTIGPGAPPWLLASSGLAPTHWFSIPARHDREPEPGALDHPCGGRSVLTGRPMDRMMEGRTYGTPRDIARARPVDVAGLSRVERTAGGPGGCTRGRRDVGRAAPRPLDADFMGGASRFVARWLPLFLLGGLFGKLMDDSRSIAVDRALT